MSNELVGPADPTPPLSALSEAEHAPAPMRDFPARSDSQLERYLAAVLRFKWVILIVTAFGTAAGLGAAQLVQLQYEAQATMWVEASEGNTDETGPIRTGQLLESYAWLELLKSYAVLDHVVEEEHLYVQAASPADAPALADFGLTSRFRPGTYQITIDPTGRYFALSHAGSVVERGRVGEPVGRAAGFDWVLAPGRIPPQRTVEFTVRNPRDVAVELGTRINTRMAREGNFVGLSLVGSGPEQLASTLNTVARRYVEVAAQLKRAKLDELTAVLEEQRRYAESNLHDAEIALESFRVQTITLPSDRANPIAAGLEITRDPVFDSFFELRVQREQLRNDREAVERIAATPVPTAGQLAALAVIPSVQESGPLLQVLQDRDTKRAELRALELRYTDQHRQVARLRTELESLERDAIPGLVGALHQQLVDRETDLDGRLVSVSGELREIPARAIEEARLRRQVAIAENLHTNLKQRYEEARLAAASSIPDIRVLDWAVVPYQPVQDQRPMLVLMGFAGALGLGIFGAVLRDRLDPRVRYPQQVTDALGLPILGMLPTAPSVVSTESASLSRLSESFRELRLSVSSAYGSAGPLVLTITSPESGDGKSFVTAQLALAFADQGLRTLVVDGDIRRGQLHRAFGALRTPGLTDFLAGTASYQSIIQPTEFKSIYCIGSGTRLHKGPELLSSAAMERLFVDLRSYFNVVLVDSPPLGAGVDAYALSTVTRNLLVVLRAGHTNRQFAEVKLDLLDRLPVRLLGAVLNATPDTRFYRYNYYLSGYELETDAPVEAALQPSHAS